MNVLRIFHKYLEHQYSYYLLQVVALRQTFLEGMELQEVLLNNLLNLFSLSKAQE